MNNYMIIILSVMMAFGYSCKDSSDLEYQRSGVNSIYATFEDGTGFFNPETPTPYGDKITFVFSTHYPAESDQVIDISRMKLKAYDPVTVTPVGNSSGVVDLTRETPVIIRHLDGTEKEYVVVGEIRKSAEAQIKEFKLPESNLPAFISEQTKVIGLVPGGIALTSQKPELTISAHATISPDPSLIQDFSKPVNYTVTAEDGTQVTYAVKQITPNKLTAGLRKGSGRLLWSKTLTQMEIVNADHMSTSIALSGEHLVVNTRNVSNRYFNRFNGDYAGNMVMGGMSSVNFQNFYSTNDAAGHILISNLVTAAGQDLYVYKWNGPDDPNPVKLIQWTFDIAGSQAGRKLSVTGNLDGDALIFMGASTSNNTILRWKVTGGVLQSQVPDKLVYTGATKWTTYADIVSEGTSTTDKLYLSGYPGNFVYTDISTGIDIGKVDLTASGFGLNHSIDLALFNKSRYLAAISISASSGFSYLYDVTDPSLLSTAPSSADYSRVCLYKTAAITSSVSNGNSTGDVLLKVSDDGYKMILYVLVTNGGVAAYEFDCVDVNNL
jgi:hypothetical protein